MQGKTIDLSKSRLFWKTKNSLESVSFSLLQKPFENHLTHIDEFKRTAGKTDRVTNRTFFEREINLWLFLKKRMLIATRTLVRIKYIIKKKHKISKRFKVSADLFDFFKWLLVRMHTWTDSATFGAIEQHVLWIFFAFTVQCPGFTVLVLILASWRKKK